ncbi:MAG: aminodeoxychorismate/anthranilate synthase component II [Candidatus Omnitrophica bacterium]|nr:aminodeoxychorismate/anthranilate synthase component II [Candidatus Omnitrophota bacterium]MBU4346876.1 aminodeoxychorismate/anthranilate synthase component II [Candidatus Omnitrophota bacterium]MBU4473411.1 aminodeoxychorismate/anthranilate synthase component II [Candidatus Omnitrophota bacterium]MCG2706964.1 aminodeoxychorismate/anthranilate synthase component II [Candidatus Omnitrophota bacterium]
MILMVDNYDSFTYNLVQYLGALGEDIKVFRNDKITISQIKKLRPKRIVISPGPGRPEDAGISCEVIREFKDEIPILGVCLGHQCLGFVFGARIIGAARLMHGKTSWIYHNKRTIFKSIPNPFEATRYHSLIVEKKTLPECLEITAWTKEGEIMGLKHKGYPLWGVQFHPESILTKTGKNILANFLKI